MYSKGPGLFFEIEKIAREILTRDYSYDRKLSVTTQSEAALDLTSTILQRDNLSVGDVAAQYKYKNATIGVKVDTQSNIATTVTLTDIVPSTKSIASVKLPDYRSGKLEVQYFHQHATLSSSVALNKSPVVDVLATCGTSSVVLGIDLAYDTSSGDFTKYNAGISVTKPDSCTSVILAEKGDLLRASYVYYLNQRRSMAVTEFTNKFSEEGNALTVGGSFAVDDFTLVKLRLNNHGSFGALLQHELKPSCELR